jgi:hypothetical protein
MSLSRTTVWNVRRSRFGDQRNPRPDERPRGVTRAVQPECKATLAIVDGVGDEGGARRGAQALPHAVGETYAEHPPPGGSEVQPGLGRRGQGIAEHGRPLAPTQPV